MNRSIWKLPKVIDLVPEHQIYDNRHKKFKLFDGGHNTYARAATIGPHNIGQTLHVHNGLKFVPVQISENLVGYKFGQFAITKKRVFHKKKKSK
jgi:ribosomal protein S19